MNRKGQFVSMIAVVALLFISGGSLFTAMYGQETFGRTVDYYSGDMGLIMDSKVRGSIFEHKVRHEMNYTENNIAWKMRNNEDGERYQWRTGEVPTYSSIKEEYEEKIMNSSMGVAGQVMVVDCYGPTLTLEYLEKDEMEVKMSDKSIRCEEDGNYAEVFFGRDDPNDKDLKVENTKNKYLRLVENALKLPEEVNQVAPSSVEVTGSEYTSSCEGGENEDQHDQQAKDSAFGEAFDQYGNVPDDAADQISTPGFVEITQKNLLFDRGPNNFEQEISDQYRDCTYTVTVSCGPNCTETETRSGTEYHTKYSYEADFLWTQYTVEDTQNQVPTFQGEKNLQFRFQYRHPLQ